MQRPWSGEHSPYEKGKSRSVWLKSRVNRGYMKCKQGYEGKSSPILSNPISHGKEFGLWPTGKEEPLKDL